LTAGGEAFEAKFAHNEQRAFNAGARVLRDTGSFQCSGREFRFHNLNAICMKEPVLHVLGLAEPELRYLRRMRLIRSFDLKRSLADFRFASIVPENILQKPSDVPCHGNLLLFDATPIQG